MKSEPAVDRSWVRRQLQHKFLYLVDGCMSSSLRYWLNDLNDFLAENNEKGMTSARKLTDSELMDLQTKMTMLDMAGVPTAFEAFRDEFRGKLREIGVEEDLLPR